MQTLNTVLLTTAQQVAQQWDRQTLTVRSTSSIQRVGLTYNLWRESNFGAYAGIGHREPNRTDLQYADDVNVLQAERMLDIEFNFRNSGEKWAFDVNAYRQQYQKSIGSHRWY